MTGRIERAPVVDEIRKLFLAAGLSDDETDVVIEKLKSELTEAYMHSPSEEGHRALCQNVAHHLTRLQLGNDKSSDVFNERYKHNHNLIVAVVGAAIFETLKALAFGLTTIVDSLVPSKGPGQPSIPLNKSAVTPDSSHGAGFEEKFDQGQYLAASIVLQYYFMTTEMSIKPTF